MLEHDVQAAHERYAEMRRAAADARRVNDAYPAPPRRKIDWRRLADSLGRRLISWGWWLRARSGSLEGL
jgi:hypothetical protein